jgi:hypothetical protein
MGIAVLYSSFRFFNISRQAMGTMIGQNIVVIKNTRNDKNLSSGAELG